jgi:hypothetical protein
MELGIAISLLVCLILLGIYTNHIKGHYFKRIKGLESSLSFYETEIWRHKQNLAKIVDAQSRLVASQAKNEILKEKIEGMENLNSNLQEQVDDLKLRLKRKRKTNP